MSASEAVERSEQSIHEKHLILRDLKTVENELSRVSGQNTRINEEYQLEKIKGMYRCVYIGVYMCI